MEKQLAVYEVKCCLCRQKIQSPTKDECKQNLSQHIDNECKVASTMRDWDRQGIYKEMISFLREDALIDKLKKFLKHYTIEQMKEALEEIERE